MTTDPHHDRTPGNGTGGDDDAPVVPNAHMLVCPECRGPLDEAPLAARCSHCQQAYPRVSGVWDLAPAQDYLYALSSVSGQRLDQLESECKRDGWTVAYRRFVDDYFRQRREPTGIRRKLRNVYLALNGRTTPGIIRSVYSRAQAYHWLLTKLAPDSTVLNLGSSWNIITHVWAGECKHLVAADATLKTLKISSLRAAENGTSNITFVHIPTSTILPFPDETFDVVLINGVLEWMPASIEGKRKEVQHKVLSDVRRILRPGGQVIVGIENRYALADLIGLPEGHVGLPWIGVMPRWLGDLYSRLTGRGPMRVTTPSARGLRRLFRKAGYPPKGTALFAPQPTYACYGVMGGVDRQACSRLERATLYHHPSVQRHVKSGFLKASLAPLSRSVAAFFGVAAKEGPFRCVLDDLMDHVDQAAGFTLRRPVGRLRVKETKAMFASRLQGADQTVHVCMAMSEEGALRVRTELEALQQILRLNVVREGRLAVPRVLWAGEFRGYPVSVLSNAEGSPLVPSARPGKAWDRTVEATEILHRISEAMGPDKDLPTVRDVWNAQWQFLRDLCHSNERQDRIGPVEEALRPDAGELATPSVFGHEDPMPGNIFAEQSTGKLTIIDWERAGAAHPLADEVRAMAGHVRKIYKGIGPTILGLLGMSPRQGPPAQFSSLCPRAAQEPQRYLTALVLVWLTAVQHGKGTAAMMDPRWLEQRAWTVLDRLWDLFVNSQPHAKS